MDGKHSLNLLDLPGEIRNVIYTDLLVIPYTPYTAMRFLPSSIDDGDKVHPQILRVNQQTHKEAIQILYGSNTFIAHPNLIFCLPRLALFYPTVQCGDMVALIRKFHVRVRLDCDPNFTLEKVTEAFSGLDELTIDVVQAQFRGSDYEVLKLFEGIRDVKRVVVIGSVSAFPEYITWLKNLAMMPQGSEVVSFTKEIAETAAAVKNLDIWTVSGIEMLYLPG